MANKQNKTLILSLLIYFFLSLFVFSFGLKKVVSLSKRVEHLKTEVKNSRGYISQMYQKQLKTYSIEGTELTKDTYLKDVDNKKVALSELLGGQPKLFIYLHTHCSNHSVSPLMHEITKVKDHIKMEDLVFFGHFHDAKELDNLRQSYPFIKKVYDVENSNFNIKFDNYHSSMMFVLGEDMQVTCVLMPDKAMTSQMCTPYLRTIGKRFFSWDKDLYVTNKHHCNHKHCSH